MGAAEDVVEWVPYPDDLISNDDSFIGDEKTKASYEKRAASFNPRSFWDVHAWNLQCLIVQEQAASAQPILHRPKRKLGDTNFETKDDLKAKSLKRDLSTAINASSSTKAAAPKEPFNPYGDYPTAYQLHETIPDFLARLRPSTTTLADSRSPWIWIASPYSTSRETDRDVGGFKQRGLKLLELLMKARRSLEDENPDKPASSITRMLKPERDQCEADLLRLAKEKNIMTGKWMLFPYPNDVDSVWKKVAQGTLDGRLGCAAKVATDDGDKVRVQRLICVYTEDFSDVEDVKRVLKEMKGLGLVRDAFEGTGNKDVIYYKCDAYTYLDIASANEYKLRASMYNSRDMFKEMGKKTW